MSEPQNINIQKPEGIVLHESAVLYLLPNLENPEVKDELFDQPIADFRIEQLSVEIIESVDFHPIKVSYSFDKQNWSNPLALDSAEWQALYPIENAYISISAIAKTSQELIDNIPYTIHQETNAENTTIARLNIGKILYQDEELAIDDIKSVLQLIAQYPKWNFYDNQQVNIQRWLDQCNAIAEMYGHTVIYFKTEPVETEHTFANHVLRNVCEVKKLKVLVPNNELPQDRNVYSEWDLPLQDDFLTNIVWNKFQQAFGEGKIPESKDYLFFPLMNKLFRVSGVQPKNGFMGKIAWWEVFLAKYEDDECVTFDEELQNSLSGIPEMDGAMAEFNVLEDVAPKNMLDEITLFKSATVETKAKEQQRTIEEKKEVTKNFSNTLVDSNNFISVKETEKYREFIAKRLKIVSVNPDEAAYPINMYNCSDVEKRVVAMVYSLKDFTAVNKFATTISESFKISFNMVLLNRFVGELLDFTENSLSHFTVEMYRKKLQLILHNQQQTFLIDYDFIEKELYSIDIEISVAMKQVAIKIFTLLDKQKTLAYQNIYIASGTVQSMQILNMQLFGGSYLANDIMLHINGNKILADYASPILQMQNFD